MQQRLQLVLHFLADLRPLQVDASHTETHVLHVQLIVQVIVQLVLQTGNDEFDVIVCDTFVVAQIDMVDISAGRAPTTTTAFFCGRLLQRKDQRASLTFTNVLSAPVDSRNSPRISRLDGVDSRAALRVGVHTGLLGIILFLDGSLQPFPVVFDLFVLFHILVAVQHVLNFAEDQVSVNVRT